MHNDSKLGLLAGVGGVIVAAVLLSRNPPSPANAPGPAAQAVAPSPADSPIARAPVASTPVAARSRPEIEGITTSRGAADEDE